MPESYSPTEFIDKINATNPGGVKFDPLKLEPLKKIVEQQQAQEGNIFIQAKQQVEAQKAAQKAAERAANTPEGKIAKAEQEIQDMKQWLLTEPNHTYTPERIDEIISRLTVRYDEDKQKAIVGGYLGLPGLTSAEGLVMPQSIGGTLYLRGLKSAEGLVLPQTTRDLDLGGLTSAEGLVLPQTTRDLDLGGLTSAEGLVLPQTIGGSLYLHGLTSAEGLKLPDNIGGYLWFHALTSADRDKLRDQYPHLANKILP